jgi:hypothetical protein
MEYLAQLILNRVKIARDLYAKSRRRRSEDEKLLKRDNKGRKILAKITGFLLKIGWVD